MRAVLLGVLLLFVPHIRSDSWRACDVTSPAFGAIGDSKHDDTKAIRLALHQCNEVLLPAGKAFLTGPLNLTSNQRLVVDGTLLASTNPAVYPMVAPLISYGWSIDSNCFPFLIDEIVPGALNYQAIVNSWNSSNVTVTGSGVIDGQGQPWWERCTKCHYKPPVGEWPHANSSCLEAGRPMLLQFTLVTGLNVHGSSVGRPLTLQNSPFWTFTPTYSQNIRIKDLVILAPMNVIGNTDGIDISSSRDAIIENVMINNSDDGICMNSGAWEFGMNLAIPTEDVLVRNITCPAGGRGGFRVGIQPGGVRNVTYRDSVLNGERGLSLLGAVGGGGYIYDILFDNITNPRGISFGNYANPSKLRPSNRYLPKVWNVEFRDIKHNKHCGNCAAMANSSVCPNVTFTNGTYCGPPTPPPAPALKACPNKAHGSYIPWVQLPNVSNVYGQIPRPFNRSSTGPPPHHPTTPPLTPLPLSPTPLKHHSPLPPSTRSAFPRPL
jgi:polygalacturonase